MLLTYSLGLTQVKATAPTAMTPEARTEAAFCQKPSPAGLKARRRVAAASQVEPMPIVRLMFFEVSMFIFTL
jgi:hypothetical protein